MRPVPRSSVILSADEIAAQVKAQKAGLAASTIKRAVNKALATHRDTEAAAQAAYDGTRTGAFERKTGPILDRDGKDTGMTATYTVPKG